MSTTDLTPVQDSTNSESLADLLTQWQRSLRSENTRRAYLAKVTAFFTWLDSYTFPALAVQREHIEAYQSLLEDQDKAPSSIVATLAALSSFYSYTESRDLIGLNPAARVARPRVDADHTETVALSTDQAKQLIRAARDLSPRAHALVAVLLQTGLRVGELLTANLDDLQEDAGHHVLTVTRKGGKRGRVVLPPSAYAVLVEYLQDGVEGRDVALPGLSGNPPLFTTSTGARMSDSEARRTIGRLGKSIGVDRLSPHSLRHTFATAGLEAGAELHHMQDALGHADPRTTRRYDHSRNRLVKSPGYLVAGILDD